LSPSLPDRLRRARERCEAAGQGHVLRWAGELEPAALARLLDQLEALDLQRLARLFESVREPPAARAAPRLEPPELIELGEGEQHRRRDRTAREAGQAALAAGQVAAFVVAGGQGSRLGFDGPKGRFPIGPLTRRSLFAFHAQRVLAASRRHGAPAPYYVMTSEANHADSVAAFEEAGWFGLDPGQVFVLVQGMLPAGDPQGRLLLADKGSLFMSPDGHGGSLRALQRSGALDDMQRRGIRQVFYFQVDNPLAPVLDPVFIGHHLLGGAEMSSKVVAKSDPHEKVGIVARIDGRPGVIEYSDLDPALATQRDAQGRLRFRAGNIAIHVLDVAFIRRVLDHGPELPVHRADKAVPCLDEAGGPLRPAQPNAVKLEQFVFDALGHAARTVTQEVRREDEFAPVKNAEGADSPATARAALVAQAKRWMAAAGLAVPAGPVEIGPLFALDPEEFAANLTHDSCGPVFDRS
jgi:UDP-N-acetylglucosamine/UDP-N-acetylgalactosamine diphosphorylase